MTSSSKGIAISCIVLSLLFMGACKERFERDEDKQQAQTGKRAAQISWESGQAVLTLDSPTQKRLGIETVILTRTATRAQVMAPAVVLSVQDLATLRNGYFAARTQLQKSRIEASVARKEYTRLKTLFEEDQNISEKSLQSAEGTLQANEADVRSAEQQLNLQGSVIRQEWGGVVATWVVNGSHDLDDIFNQRQVLVQMTLSASTPFEPPKTISLEAPAGARTQARFISPFPRIDPRVQGKSFLYLAAARPDLSPGVNLVAHLSAGQQMQGVVVPTSAVVWSEGKAWAYRQTAADRFVRRAVPTDTAVENGFFLTTGLSAGDKVVTLGAQALLSEELLLHGQSGSEADVD
jgi:hypothetical protein